MLGDRAFIFYRGKVCAELTGTQLRVHTVLEPMNMGLVAVA